MGYSLTHAGLQIYSYSQRLGAGNIMEYIPLYSPLTGCCTGCAGSFHEPLLQDLILLQVPNGLALVPKSLGGSSEGNLVERRARQERQVLERQSSATVCSYLTCGTEAALDANTCDHDLMVYKSIPQSPEGYLEYITGDIFQGIYHHPFRPGIPHPKNSVRRG